MIADDRDILCLLRWQEILPFSRKSPRWWPHPTPLPPLGLSTAHSQRTSHGQRRGVLLIINGEGVSKSLMSPSCVRSNLLCIPHVSLAPASALVAVQLLSHVKLFATPWTAACEASLSFTIFPSLLKLMFIVSMMPFSRFILCRSLLLLPSVFPSIRVFFSESALRIRWPKYWSFSFSPSNEYSGLVSFRIDWFDLLAVQGTLKSLLQYHNLKASGPC